MPYPITLRVAARHLLLLVAAAIVFASCTTVYELYAPPGATINPPRQGNYENPDNYRVDSASYPQYRAVKTFTPPSPKLGESTSRFGMVDIVPGDEWIVTHRINDQLVIYSKSYQARQRKFASGKDNFIGPYLYHLFIDPNGRVNQGWLLLKNPQVVVASRDRYVIMDPRLRESAGWPEEPLFVPIK